MQRQLVTKARNDHEAAATPTPVDTTPAPSAPPPNRQRLRRLLMTGVPLVVALVGLGLYLTSGRYVETEDAYVKADKVSVSAEVNGPIVAVTVADNQHVEPGDELFRLDERPFRIALERAEAELHTVQAELESQKASYRQKQEELDLARNDVAFAEREFARQSGLARQKLNSQAALDQAQHALDTARRRVAVIGQEQAQILAQLNGAADIEAKDHPRYRAALAARDEAQLNLERTRVRAPFAGVASRVPYPGLYVNAGSPVMSVVADRAMWIEANFMETDLTHVRPGQRATIEIDTYPGREWHGSVQSISQATGAEFSVLPPQNASGNWVKIVQRIPVRIAVETAAGDPPLRVGMTSTITIDTGRHHLLPWFGRSHAETGAGSGQGS